MERKAHVPESRPCLTTVTQVLFSEADFAIPPFLPQQLWTAAPAHGSECECNTQAPKEVNGQEEDPR